MISRKKAAELLQRAARQREAGQPADAAATYRRLLRDNPASVDALYLLGTLLAEAGDLDSAEGYLRQAHRLHPTSDLVMVNLGTLSRLKGDLQAGIDWYERALAVAADNPALAANLGSAYLNAGRDADAEPHLRRYLAQQPGHVAALCLLGDALRGQKRLDEAAEQYRKALAIAPEAAEARHALAACTGEAPEQAPASYARKVFDTYAPHYDAHYGAVLASNGPQRLREAVERRFAGRHDLRALDLGCGTGLAAAALRPLCARLVGVDVSPAMLAVAQRKALYDDLVERDVLAHLQQSAETFDLIVAQDVLPYFGALVEPLQAARRSAAPGAVLVLTIESTGDTTDAADADWRLGAGVRYAHSQAYLRRAATEAGWTVAALEGFEFRREQDGWTPGWLVELEA
ncbi:tetratricopeptide repeat protein [Ideonella sp. A 288]|uniref:tetratricopeptide repeat protein n=1 Tax=Ideonella sp. A 288 TaxID=1962181 RepID=UPI00130361FC|nr:tetratricopeptide repeat protein [Ideonella sp. A 288]